MSQAIKDLVCKFTQEDADSIVSIVVGASIKFYDEPNPYTVQAVSENFAVLTRPATQEDAESFEVENLEEGTVVYSIWDLWAEKRGPHNMILNAYDFKTPEGCQECLSDLEAKKIELSRRREARVILDGEYRLPVPLKEYIIQIHWQECFPWEGDEPKLIFVAQHGFKSSELPDPVLWIHSTIEEKKDECPKGYQPMVCDETSSYFLKAPVQP